MPKKKPKAKPKKKTLKKFAIYGKKSTLLQPPYRKKGKADVYIRAFNKNAPTAQFAMQGTPHAQKLLAVGYNKEF